MAISVQVGIQAQRRSSRAQDSCFAQVRALALWPRLDRRALTRCGCDPARIANYVSRRTRLPTKAIETLLSQSQASPGRAESGPSVVSLGIGNSPAGGRRRVRRSA